MTWRAKLGSSAVGSRSLLRETPSLSVADAERAAQRHLDALRQRGEIGFAVERRENGAAHESGAAKRGQDRAGKPLHRDAAAIDEAAGAAVDRQRRLVAELDGLGLPRSIAPRDREWLQARRPLRLRSKMARPQPQQPTRRGRPLESRPDTMPVGPWPVNDGPRTGDLRLTAAADRPPLRIPSLEFEAKDDAGIWPQCGAARRLKCRLVQTRIARLSTGIGVG